MNEVHAVIELRITPQRDCGFGKIAERVAKFEQVEACFLMSGGYDLLAFVKGDSLQDVAHFVAADLSTIDGVLSTATHFLLKTYKARDGRKEFAGELAGYENGDVTITVGGETLRFEKSEVAMVRLRCEF